MANLELPDLNRLTNNPIAYTPWWPTLPHKILSDIPKFNGNLGEDPSNCVMTFHLWCSSNTLNDDSIRLHLFQQMLTGLAEKWYIELPRALFDNFNALSTTFLTHFQLPIRYEMGTELLTNFKQMMATHIYDHIHEWRRRRRMVKTYVPDQLLAEWLIKSLLPSIMEYVAKGGVVTEEKVIARAQYLDLIYTHSSMLYVKIPDATRPKFFVPPSPKSNKDSHVGDGVIGMTNTKTTKAKSKKAHTVLGQNENEELLASEVNSISIDKGKETKQRGGKKKKKGKKKKQDESSPEKSSANPFGDRKPKSTCLICDEDHWTRECPYKAKLRKFFNNSKTLAVLTDLFPNPGTNLVASENSSPSQVLMLPVSKKKNDAFISTRNKDYRNP